MSMGLSKSNGVVTKKAIGIVAKQHNSSALLDPFS